MISPLPPYEFFDHTADVGLVARGATLPDLFRHAALGVMALVVDPATVHPGGVRDRVRAEALDLETLLVNWLNQVLFLHNVQKMVFCRFQVRSFSSGRSVLSSGVTAVPSPPSVGEDARRAGEGECFIEAEAEGELLDPGRHAVLREVKSATFHALRVEKTAQGYEARIVLDV